MQGLLSDLCGQAFDVGLLALQWRCWGACSKAMQACSELCAVADAAGLGGSSSEEEDDDAEEEQESLDRAQVGP